MTARCYNCWAYTGQARREWAASARSSRLRLQARRWWTSRATSWALLEARSVVGAVSAPGCAAVEDLPVLLVFENGDATLPIILGIVSDRLRAEAATEVLLDQPRDGVIDGKKIVLEAKEEIVLLWQEFHHAAERRQGR